MPALNVSLNNHRTFEEEKHELLCYIKGFKRRFMCHLTLLLSGLLSIIQRLPFSVILFMETTNVAKVSSDYPYCLWFDVSAAGLLQLLHILIQEYEDNVYQKNVLLSDSSEEKRREKKRKEESQREIKSRASDFIRRQFRLILHRFR
jgi:hypothetical protein